MPRKEEHPFDKLARALVSDTISRGRMLKLVGAALLSGPLSLLLWPREAEAHHHHRHRCPCPRSFYCTRNSSGTRFCCPLNGGSCCRPAYVCGSICCKSDQTCCNGGTSQTCCAPEETCCKGSTSQTCCAPGEVCETLPNGAPYCNPVFCDQCCATCTETGSVCSCQSGVGCCCCSASQASACGASGGTLCCPPNGSCTCCLPGQPCPC
jgi:hypothetical protein